MRGYQLELTIKNTSLKEFPSIIFNSFNGISLLNLILKNNRIETINPFESHFKLPILNQHGTILIGLSLANNPIECDCRMNWLSKWIEHHSADTSPQWIKTRNELAETKCNKVKF